MDVTEIANVKPVLNNLYDFLGINNRTSHLHKDKKTVIKYTKMPEHDVESSISWQNNTQPKLRRVADLPQEDLHTTNSIRSNLYYPKSVPYSSSVKRKIITMEDDKSNTRILNSENTSTSITKNKKTLTTLKPKDNNEKSQRNLCSFLKTGLKEANTDSRTGTVKHEFRKSTVNSNNSSKNYLQNSQSHKSKELSSREEDCSRYKRSPVHDTKKKENNIPKRQPVPVFDKGTPKKKLSNLKTNDSQNNTKHPAIKKTADIIKKEVCNKTVTKNDNSKNNKACETDIKIQTKNVAINVIPETKHINTETVDNEYLQNITSHYDKKDECQINSHNCIPQYDSLSIPNISLKKDKSVELTEEKSSDLLSNYSLPNLEIPSLTISKYNDLERSNNNGCHNESSYIISRATVTYTTEQKIDFEVVGKEIDISEVTPASTYPLNVVSALKKEIKRKKKGLSKTFRNISNPKIHSKKASINDCGLSLRRSWRDLNRNRLIKPSDIISTMTHNNLFANSFISEQFQKELDFIDSFIESLQYLENCSLSKKTHAPQVQRSFHGLFENKKNQINKTKYNVFLPQHIDSFNKLDYHINTKNLCLLNMLIRDEQRRAKNLLFVLKMREDALKNFTKSQILWLENKKKHENTDSSTLKKKQRGALLRLQHECGEMNKIRKSLVSLSEKRKAILLKTKKNIELKMSQGSEQVSTSTIKKKVRKSSTESTLSPLKCYNLSESSYNESTISKDNSNEHNKECNNKQSLVVTSVEKSIQTSDSILGTLINDQPTNVPAESFVAVDGSYLNIIFQNLTLPKMFFEGKQYEVNEEALSNILTSSNILKDNVFDTKTIGNFVEQLENCDSESTPSTARSLVDEFNQYYKDMESYEQHSSSITNASGSDEIELEELVENNENYMFMKTKNVADTHRNLLEMTEVEELSVENNVMNNIELISEDKCMCDSLKRESSFEEIIDPVVNMNESSSEVPLLYKLTSMPSTKDWQSANNESPNQISLTLDEPITIESEACSEIMSAGILPPPAVSEAEELRRQQLAIELEIKAIEQQQSLVVREIPDKPPPPYMPPADKRKISSIVRFTTEYCLESKVKECLQKPNTDPDDPFEELIKDFCIEKNEKLQAEVSDKPWDAYNLVPSVLDKYKGNIHKQISVDLGEVLANVSSKSALLALGNRRSDHTDEILFSEWRGCEKEWTSLHIDEAHVKNQLFDSIFEKILSDSIDEYKKTVLEGNIKTD